MAQKNINGNVYKGLPLQISTFDGEYWSGRSNFATGNRVTSEISLQLADLDDCFEWMELWAAADDYQYGYVLDFENRTIYYDDARALDHLQQKTLPKNNLADYFEAAIERKFVQS